MSTTVDIMEDNQKKPKDAKDVKKALDAIRNKINDKYQKQTKNDAEKLVYSGAEIREQLKPTYSPVGIASLDDALGGGFADRVITAIWGPPGCGKTSLALMEVAAEQAKGGTCMWVDAEFEFPYNLAMLLGVDIDTLEIVQPKDYGEQILDVINEYLFDSEARTARGAISLIVIDSVNGLVPKAKVNQLEDKGQEGQTVGRTPAMISEWMGMLAGRGMLRKGTKMTCIAQARTDIANQGILKMSCGLALAHMSKVIMQVSKQKLETNPTAGHNVKVRITKNAVKGMPGEADYPVMYGVGVDDSGDVLERAINSKIVEKIGRSDYIIHLPTGDLTIEGGIKELRARVQMDVALKNSIKPLLPEKKLKNFSMQVTDEDSGSEGE